MWGPNCRKGAGSIEYTVLALARLAGVTPRTLRHYDAIGLLRPARVASSGYRIYGRQEVDRLQLILFYRELGLPLPEIAALLDAPDSRPQAALESHLAGLRQKRRQLDGLIATVEKTILCQKGELQMTDKEKFEAFKKEQIEKNEQAYGGEIREKYGEDAIDASNAKMMNMTDEEYKAFTALGQQLNESLKNAVQAGDPASALGQKTAALHKQWLLYTWAHYTPEAHKGLAQMYVDDERFAAYYEKIAPGAAAFLRDAIFIFCG